MKALGITPEPNYYGRKLIRKLKALRAQVKLTQAQVCERAHFEPKKFSRLESRQLVTYHELCMLLEVYGVLTCDWQPYVDLWEQAKQPAWWNEFRLNDTRYLRMEDVASTRYEFQLGLVPDLMQTRRYAHEAIASAPMFRDTETINKLVEVRMRRQQRLLSGHLSLHSLIHQSVLYQKLGLDQLCQLVERAELSNVTLQLIPVDTALPDGLNSSIALLSFPDPAEPDFAFADTVAGCIDTQDPDQVANAGRAIKHLSSDAMSSEESLMTLRGMID
jgi:transcriptional regulator with XRE-family HTH domain